MRICEKMVNRGLGEAHNQVSSARRSLRTFGQVVRETPGPVMASLVLGLIVLSYYFSQVWFLFADLGSRYVTYGKIYREH